MTAERTTTPLLRAVRGAWAAAAACVLALGSGAAQADGLADLQGFLRQAREGRASFTQVVTPPARAGQPAGRSKTSQGVFEFQRPDRFRFQYTRPFEQTIVADGQTLWLYDADLNQVSARRQQEVLGQTPAALLAGAADLAALAQAFELQAEADADGLSWVRALPRQRDGQVQQVRIGLRQGLPAQLEVLDGFGQRSVLTFGPMDTAPRFGAGQFRFVPPPGAAVIQP